MGLHLSLCQVGHRLDSVKIALMQVAVTDDETPAARTKRVLAWLDDAAHCDLVILPELWQVGAFAMDAWRTAAAPLESHDVIQHVRDFAARTNTLVHAGSVVERDADHLYNTSVVVTGEGVAATYRKIHRFGFAGGEKSVMSAGHHAAVESLPVAGRDFRTHLSTCFDLRFPELYRVAATHGAELSFISSSWPTQREHAWRTLIQARAIENQTIVIACNAAGRHAGQTMAGHSMIVLPDGHIVAEAGLDEELVIADADPIHIEKMRRSFPVLEDRLLTVCDDAPATSAAPQPTPPTT